MDSLGQFFEGEIIAIRPTGTLDIKTAQGAIFQNTPQLDAVGQRELQLGQAVVVVTAAGKNYCLGPVSKPENQPDGTVHTKSKTGVFPRDRKATKLKSRNIDGSTAEISVSPATGLLLDSGSTPLLHMDPGQETIMISSRDIETHTPRSVARVGSKGVNYLFRAENDVEQLSKELAGEPAAAPSGAGVSVSVFEDSDTLIMVVMRDGAPNLSLEIKSNGELIIQSPDFGFFRIDSDGVHAGSQTDARISAAAESIVEGASVKLGSDGASEGYVLLSRLHDVLSSVVLRMTTHQHLYTVPLIPGAVAPTLPDPATNLPTLGTPLTWNLGSTKIKGE